jgi:hypothetical protein
MPKFKFCSIVSINWYEAFDCRAGVMIAFCARDEDASIGTGTDFTGIAHGCQYSSVAMAAVTAHFFGLVEMVS